MRAARVGRDDLYRSQTFADCGRLKHDLHRALIADTEFTGAVVVHVKVDTRGEHLGDANRRCGFILKRYIFRGAARSDCSFREFQPDRRNGECGARARNDARGLATTSRADA